MANVFDQFDAPVAGGNPFDRFDAPATAPQTGPRDAETVRAEYDAKPWYKQAGQAADDVVRLIANGMTFGFADKVAGALPGGAGTEGERVRTQEARDRAGLAGDVAEIGGAVATPVGMGKAGATMLGRFGTKGLTGLTGLGARSGLGAIEGAGYGGLSALGNDQDISDGATLGAIFGAGGNVAAETLANTVGAAAGAFGRRAAPTMDELATARDAAYKAADDAGVVFTPASVDRIRTRAVQELADMGYDPALQPGAAAVLRRVEDLAGQNVTLKGLDTLRKVAGNGYVPGNKSNDRALGILVNAIDDAVDNPAAGEMLMGDAQAGAAALREARELARRAFKGEEVNNAIVRAERRAASTGKGGNIDNATRQNLRGILDRGARGYTPDEVGAMETVVRGTPAQNLLRWGGGLAPQNIVGGGMGAFAGGSLASAVGLPPLVGAGATMALGQGSKWAADAMTRNSVDNLVDLIMSGVRPQPNAVQRGAASLSDDAVRAIIGGSAAPSGPSERR